MPKARPKKQRVQEHGGPKLTDPEGVMMLVIAAFADFVPPIFVLILNGFYG